MASKYAKLNDQPNLKPTVYKTGDRAGKRKLTSHRNDEIGEALAACTKPSDFADFAAKAGITDKEIADRAASAPNFGQFRMTLGNRIRGIIGVLEKAQKEDRSLTKAQAAAYGSGKQYADPKDLPPKKVRVKKEKMAKPTKEKKPVKAKKATKTKVERMVPPKEGK